MNGRQWREEIHERHRKEKLETYLFAMKEDLSEWLAGLMNISVAAESFMDVLDNGIHLCRLANMIQKAAEKYLLSNPDTKLCLPTFTVTYKERGATYGSFVSRDNVANFIRWCRELGIPDVIIFESEDLVLHRYQKPVILTLLDVARRAAKFDVEPPDLVKMEEEIDEEIAMEQEALQYSAQQQQQQQDVNNINDELTTLNNQQVIVKPKRQNIKPKTKNFIPKNLDTLVKETVQQCTCADNPFPVEKIADGKYTIGENRVLIFVRVMRNHVMVRVGGGWDTLENYIQKHDPCRTGGRSTGGGRHKSRCQTPNLGVVNNENGLQSASTTSVASSDSSSSTSSLSRLSPNSSTSTSLQGMVCVFGETGPRTEIVSSGDVSPSGTPSKRFDTPTKTDVVTKRSMIPARAESDVKCNGTKHKPDSQKPGLRSPTVIKRRTPPENKLTYNTMSTSSLRKSLQDADLSFNRSKTSDAILSRSRRVKNVDSPVVKRRGTGNLSREASSENMRQSRSKSTGRRRRYSEGRKRSPEVRKRSAISPSPARRRLDLEYETKPTEQKRSALRKDLNENNLFFSRSFSADTIRRGSGPGEGGQFRSRIPVPLAVYGKPRGARSSTEKTQSSNDDDERCHHCGEYCTCDEGFIDGDISRSLRPTTLFSNNQKQREFEETALTPRTNGAGAMLHNGEYGQSSGPLRNSENQRNGRNSSGYENDDISWKNRISGNGVNPDGSWKEVMTDILKFEENRIPDQRL